VVPTALGVAMPAPTADTDGDVPVHKYFSGLNGMALNADQKVKT
jgi:hypothetical protein